MEGKKGFDGIAFADTWREFEAFLHMGRVAHILCCGGGMRFTFRNVRYDVAAGDYVILPDAEFGRDFLVSDDFRGILMSLSDTFVASMAIRNNYGAIGHLSLMQDPVMNLASRDFQVCRQAMQHIRERLGDKGHLFREELLGSLLTAHILDLYDIHARGRKGLPLSERVASLLTGFMEMLYGGEPMRHRNLGYYASRLCVTTHYLSEICKKVSGRPASYWIDRFTIHEIVRQLRQKGLPLTAIAERMNFSSVSYLSRYVRKRTGMSPSEYRKGC